MAENKPTARPASPTSGPGGDKAISLAGLSKKFYLRNEAAGSIKEAFATVSAEVSSGHSRTSTSGSSRPDRCMRSSGTNGSGKSTLLVHRRYLSPDDRHGAHNWADLGVVGTRFRIPPGPDGTRTSI